MDSRERVTTCLNHKEPDRVPIDFWATKEVIANLIKYYSLQDEEQLLQRLGADFRYIEGPRYVGPDLIVRADGSQEDHFGVPRKPVTYSIGEAAGAYSEVVEYPLEKAASLDEILSYPKWPKADWFDYECVREQAARARESGKMVVFMGDRLNRCAQFKPAMYVRGVEQILVDILADPDIAKAVFTRIAQFYMEYARRTLEAAEGNIDIFFTGDDFGTQENMFMPLGVWQALLQDGFRRFVTLGHEFGCKVAHHTCGCIAPMIPDFVDCGLDILNCLQPEAAGMDYVKIKRDYGADLCFHGAISIQKTMPFGTPQDVRNEVQSRTETLAPGGGYIFCTAHNIQIDTSLENVDALFSAYKESGAYA